MSIRRRCSACLLLPAWLLLVSPALAEPAPRTWQVGALRFVATGSKLQTWDLRDPAGPRLADERQFAGPIADLRIEGELVVAVVMAPQIQVLSFDREGRLAEFAAHGLPVDVTAAAARPGLAQSPWQIGRVVATGAGDVVVALEPPHVPRPGWSVRLRSEAQPADLDLDAEDGYETTDEPVVGRIVRVDGQRALVELPRGATAAVGDVVERGQAVGSLHRWFVPMSAYSGWLSAGVQAVLPLDSALGLGFEFGAGYVAGPLTVQVRGKPFTWIADSGFGPSLLTAALAFEGDWGAIGLGGGTMRRVDWWCGWMDEFSGGSCTEWVPAGQILGRIGSQDGVNLELAIAAAERAAQFDGRLVVPVNRTADLRMAWVAREDYGSFEIGSRVYVRGLGGPDTLILSWGIGGLAADVEDFSDLLGPHLTLAIEVRH